MSPADDDTTSLLIVIWHQELHAAIPRTACTTAAALLTGYQFKRSSAQPTPRRADGRVDRTPLTTTSYAVSSNTASTAQMTS